MPAGREPGQRHGSGDEDKHQRHGEQVGASPRGHHYTLSGIVVWHVFEVRCSALGDVANTRPRPPALSPPEAVYVRNNARPREQ